MNYTSFNSLPPLQNHLTKISAKKNLFVYLTVIILFSIILPSCAPAKFSGKESGSIAETSSYIESVPVRVLIDSDFNLITFSVESPFKVYSGQKALAYVKKGNKIEITSSGSELIMTISGHSFTSDEFRFLPASEGESFDFNGKKYRGTVSVKSNKKIINVVSLEDYLKGVLPAEMPAGKGNENFEALKAQAVCARTYTMMKLNEKKPDFDLYIDVRDQVYGGVESEKEITNRAIEETRGMILNYNNTTAVVFYSASCGGYTEQGENVFISVNNAPYLASVKDGDDPYCSITPRFQWEEKYPHQEIINRYIKNGLIVPGNYTIKSLNVKSRFESGRVNELEVIFATDSTSELPVSIYGNKIRSILRTADNKGILRSTMFDLSDEDGNIVIKGKGNGHGVGLCQWGAIAQSRSGKKFDEILMHYFPGTEIFRSN